MLTQVPPTQRFSIMAHSSKSSPSPPRPGPRGQSFWNSFEFWAGQDSQPRPHAAAIVQQQFRRVMFWPRGPRQNFPFWDQFDKTFKPYPIAFWLQLKLYLPLQLISLHLNKYMAQKLAQKADSFHHRWKFKVASHPSHFKDESIGSTIAWLTIAYF